MAKKPTTKSLLANTFIAEALEVISRGENVLPDMGPRKKDDKVIGQMTEFEKALFVVALKASADQIGLQFKLNQMLNAAKAVADEMSVKKDLLGQKSEFVAKCAWFLIYQRLDWALGFGIFIRESGTLVTNIEDTSKQMEERPTKKI